MLQQPRAEQTFNVQLLLLSTLIISGCSLIYEVLISSISSYLLGDSIKQFSITIGLYMCAMGVGSYLSKFLKDELFDWFVFVETGVGIVGGLSSLLLFYSHIYVQSYELVMYFEIIIIGTLVGLEIPLLTRIIEAHAGNLRVTLSWVFSFDYLGGLIGSIAFPLLLLPQLGYFATAFLTGMVNILIALVIIFTFRNYIKRIQFFKIAALLVLALMLAGTIFAENIAEQIEGGLYRDRVIYSRQTKYQKLVLTKHKDDLRLFINGNVQFSSMDEYRYHEALVHIPMAAVRQKAKILILGGGDGLAVREVLKYPAVRQITLVDLDEAVVKLCKTHHDIVQLNGGALEHPKLQVVIDDAYKYLEKSQGTFDVIIVDLPDPNNETLNKLYTNLFYRLCANHLNPAGAMVVQSTSPYYATNAFWCIHKTMEMEGLNVIPYHTEVPAFGDWGFQLASRKPIDLRKIRVAVKTRFLNAENLPGLFLFANDERAVEDTIRPNTLSRPQLLTYYMEAEENWR